MSAPREAYRKALQTLMRHVVATKNRELVLSPDTLWDGSKKFKFKIHGRSDSDFSGNKDDRRSISGGRVFVNNNPVSFRSKTQKMVTFSVKCVQISNCNMHVCYAVIKAGHLQCHLLTSEKNVSSEGSI